MKTVPCPECKQRVETYDYDCKSCGVSETLMAWLAAAEKYLEMKQYENSERFYKKALELLEDRYGSEHPEIAMSLYGLARTYSVRGNLKEAESFYKRAAEIIEKILPAHPKAGKIISGFGEHFLRQKRYAEAEALFRRALAIQQKSLGRSHPETKSIRGKLSSACKGTKRAGTAVKPP